MAKKNRDRRTIFEEGRGRLYPASYKAMPNFMRQIPSWINAIPTVEAAERANTARRLSLDEIARIINQTAEALAPGNSEFKNILHAIALAESGGNNLAVGDKGQSFGVFQNRRKLGRGGNYSITQLQDPTFEIPMAVSDLYQYYLNAKKRGLNGADAASYVSKYGQRPAAGHEKWPYNLYGETVGNMAIVHGISPTPSPTLAMKPTGVPPSALKSTDKDKSWWDKVFNMFQPKIYSPVPKAEASETTASASVPTPYKPYTVGAGETLWGIAQRQLGEGNRWRELTGYQGDPRQMPIGQRLQIPIAASSAPSRSTAAAPVPYPAPTPMRRPSVKSSPRRIGGFAPTNRYFA